MKTRIIIALLLVTFLLQVNFTPEISLTQAYSVKVAETDDDVAQCKMYKADDPDKNNLLLYQGKWISGDDRGYEESGFRNETEIVFEATFVNPTNSSVTLRSFKVDFYHINGSAFLDFSTPIILTYSQKEAEKVIIAGRSCKTEHLALKLFLPFYEQEVPTEEVGAQEQQVEQSAYNRTNDYICQYIFDYGIGQASSKNFTIRMLSGLPQKPTILLWIIGGLLIIVFAMVVLASYGRITITKKGEY